MTRAEELLAQVLKKEKEECKACKIILWVLAVVGIIAAVAGIAYAVYRFVKPDYLEDYEDDIDDEFDYDERSTEVLIAGTFSASFLCPGYSCWEIRALRVNGGDTTAAHLSGIQQAV